MWNIARLAVVITQPACPKPDPGSTERGLLSEVSADAELPPKRLPGTPTQPLTCCRACPRNRTRRPRDTEEKEQPGRCQRLTDSQGQTLGRSYIVSPTALSGLSASASDDHHSNPHCFFLALKLSSAHIIHTALSMSRVQIIMTSASGYLRILRYCAPFTIVVCGAFSAAAIVFFVPPSRRATLSASQRALSKHFIAAICSLHFLDGLIQSCHATIEADAVARPDCVAYTTLNFLLWLVTYIIQVDAKWLYWMSNLATWTLALFLDTVITLSTFSSYPSNVFEFIQLSIGLLRIVCLVFLCVSIIASGKPRPRDAESEPLLQASHESRSSHLDDDLQDAKQDADGADDTLPTSEQQEHIEKVGGWWAYLCEVKFLLPYVLPFKDARRQIYALVMVVLMVAGRVAQLFGPRLLGNIVQAISNNHNDSTLSHQILIYIFAVKVPYDVLIEPARKWLSIRLFYGSYLDLLMSLASHVAGLSYAFHENKQTGEIIAAIGQGQVVNQFVDDFVESTLPLVLDIVIAFAYVTYLFDVYVALILTGTYVFYGIVTYKGTVLCAAARRKYREMSRVEWDVLHEAIANWMSTFYLNRQEHQQNRLKSLSLQVLAEQAYNYDLTGIMRTCQTLVVTFGYLAVLLRTAHLTTHTKDAVGNFVALLFYWSFFINPLFKLAHFYHSLVQILVDVERLRQLMQTEPTVFDNKGAQDLIFYEGKVEYRDVSFSYDGKNSVINNLTLTIEPGSTVAFVGQSGSGKTTTCDKLLFRAYDVTEGSISIDNQDIRGVTQKSLRETVGIVRQEPVFNNDTVMENVRYARLDATDAEVVAACKDAAIHDQIMRFPMAYNTVVGERGVKLSGGERQRLAIAQLFLRNPSIIVLDEATSSIDNVAESEIQESFRRICQGRTTIVIAHRLSTVQHADQIFVMDKGAIIERGTHEELLNQRGKYLQLWSKTQTVKKLKSDLDRIQSQASEEHNDCGHPTSFEESECEDDSDYPADIMQVDGAGTSKHNDEERPRMRQRMRSLRKKFRINDRAREGDCMDESDDEDENMAPIRVISPRTTEASPPPTFSRRSSLSLRRPSRTRKASITSTSDSPNRNQLRISAPMSPIRVRTQEIYALHDPVGLQPLQGPTPPTPKQPSHSSTPSRIPISNSPLTTPVRNRQSTARETQLQSPQSPGRNAALRSHPVLRTEEEADGSETTYHMAGMSLEGHERPGDDPKLTAREPWCLGQSNFGDVVEGYKTVCTGLGAYARLQGHGRVGRRGWKLLNQGSELSARCARSQAKKHLFLRLPFLVLKTATSRWRDWVSMTGASPNFQ
ncbi:heavy metal tolerance protein precursor [Paraphaeosphaeria sporulosa]